MRWRPAHTRNRVEGWLYRTLAKPVFFRMDPEVTHDRVALLGRGLGRIRATRAMTRFFFDYQNPKLEQDIAGIHFRNPIGLGAGFDKDAQLLQVLPEVGFGFLEIGSITAKPYAGNKGKRLHRLPHIHSIVVNYGLKSQGVEVVAERLRKTPCRIPIGTSIAPTNIPENADVPAAIADYLVSYQALAEIGEYTTLNLSCPNTCNSQPFLEPSALDQLLTAVDGVETKKPVFLKISPDISDEVLEGIVKVAAKHKVAGFICTNLTKRRDRGLLRGVDIPISGGVSGRAVQEYSDKLLAKVARLSRGRFTIIGLGGVFTAEDAYRKIRLGASLVQVVTGMFFGGPQTISSINQGLVDLLERDGFASISEAIGVDLK